jgi:serine/threonine protein kinase
MKVKQVRNTYLLLEFIVSCVVLALEYLHRNQIIHRDIKPENLIFDSNGYIYLTDFGIAKRLADNKICLDTSGTPGYMAPEVVSKLNHTFPADYFSLGVILYEIMMKRV